MDLFNLRLVPGDEEDRDIVIHCRNATGEGIPPEDLV